MSCLPAGPKCFLLTGSCSSGSMTLSPKCQSENSLKEHSWESSHHYLNKWLCSLVPFCYANLNYMSDQCHIVKGINRLPMLTSIE